MRISSNIPNVVVEAPDDLIIRLLLVSFLVTHLLCGAPACEVEGTFDLSSPKDENGSACSYQSSSGLSSWLVKSLSQDLNFCGKRS